jgi:hypothetical protein
MTNPNQIKDHILHYNLQFLSPALFYSVWPNTPGFSMKYLNLGLLLDRPNPSKSNPMDWSCVSQAALDHQQVMVATCIGTQPQKIQVHDPKVKEALRQMDL